MTDSPPIFAHLRQAIAAARAGRDYDLAGTEAWISATRDQLAALRAGTLTDEQARTTEVLVRSTAAYADCVALLKAGKLDAAETARQQGIKVHRELDHDGGSETRS